MTYALNVGGLESVLLSLARGLRSKGCKVTFVVTDSVGEWHERPMSEGFATETVLVGRWESRQSHAKKLGRMLSQFDVVLLNHSRPAQSATGLIAESTVVLSVLHNHVEDVYTVGLTAVDNLDSVVAVGERVRQEALKRGLLQEKIACIRNGVDVFPEYPKLGHAFAAQPLQIMYLGRIVQQQKGVFYLCEIMGRLKNHGVPCTLHIVGDGPDQEALTRLMREANVSERVILYGNLPHEQAMRLLSTVDALVMPSHYEGQPITLFEAMSRGVVPVVSLLPGITDAVIANGTDGFLVPVADSAAFAAALEQLDNRDLVAAMSRATWQKALNNFSVEVMTQQYLNLIADCRERRLSGFARQRTKELDLSLLGKRSQVPLVFHEASGLLKDTLKMRGVNDGD